jgi:hypothetical protein
MVWALRTCRTCPRSVRRGQSLRSRGPAPYELGGDASIVVPVPREGPPTEEGWPVGATVKATDVDARVTASSSVAARHPFALWAPITADRYQVRAEAGRQGAAAGTTAITGSVSRGPPELRRRPTLGGTKPLGIGHWMKVRSWRPVQPEVTDPVRCPEVGRADDEKRTPRSVRMPRRPGRRPSP